MRLRKGSRVQAPGARMQSSELSGDELATKVLHQTGVLPAHLLKAMIRAGEIGADEPVLSEQLQPASLDLRLGRSPIACVRASFPGARRGSPTSSPASPCTRSTSPRRGPRNRLRLSRAADREPETFAAHRRPREPQKFDRADRCFHAVVDRRGRRVRPRARRPTRGRFTRKSAHGRFRSWCAPGPRLNQLRLKRGGASLEDAELWRLHADERLIAGGSDWTDIAQGIALSADLKGRRLGSRRLPRQAPRRAHRCRPRRRLRSVRLLGSGLCAHA